MAALDFPSSPSVGQTYPAPAVAGVPVYTWDGVKWITNSASLGGKTPVYTDGSNPMSAPLTLSGDPVNPTDAADKHYVDGLIAGVTAIPSGTVMLFCQAAAPVGWTQVTTQNDKLLRVVSGGTGGAAGGTQAFSTWAAQTVGGAHTLGVNEIPTGLTATGTNTITVYAGGNGAVYTPVSTGNWASLIPMTTGAGNPVAYYGGSMSTVQSFTGGNTINVTGNNASGSSHTHPVNYDIQYVNVILASKN
jgi:hypothetical protein